MNEDPPQPCPVILHRPSEGDSAPAQTGPILEADTRTTATRGTRAGSVSSVRSTASAKSAASSAVVPGGISEKASRIWLASFADEVDHEPLLHEQNAGLSESIAIRGVLFLSQSFLAFHSKLPLFKRHIVIPIQRISDIQRNVQTFVYSSAIRITLVPDPSLASETPGPTSEEYIFGSGSWQTAFIDDLLQHWSELAPEAYQTYIAANQTTATATVANPNSSSADQDRSVASVNSVSTGSPASLSPSEVEKTLHHPATLCHAAPLAHENASIQFQCTPKELFNLMYHSQAWQDKFYVEDKSISELVITPWQENRRSISYKKALANKIGPSSTMCHSEEVLREEDPEVGYVIEGTTQTPDVPSGSSFVIRSRTSISWSGSNGGCLYKSTTELDWSAKSIIKGTITKAVLSGQESHALDQAAFARRYFAAHADEFTFSKYTGSHLVDEKSISEGIAADMKSLSDSAGVSQEDSVLDKVIQNPALAVAALSLLLNCYFLCFGRGPSKSPAATVAAINRQAIAQCWHAANICMETALGKA